MEFPPNDARQFHFPAQLEHAIEELSWFIVQEGSHLAKRPRRAGLIKGFTNTSKFLMGLIHTARIHTLRDPGEGSALTSRGVGSGGGGGGGVGGGRAVEMHRPTVADSAV